MKFAKELQRDLVPEWQQAYLNYKEGKKHIKVVARAINRAKGKGLLTPNLARRSPDDLPPHPTPSFSPRRKQSYHARPLATRGTAQGEDGDIGNALSATRSKSTPAPGPSRTKDGLTLSPALDIAPRKGKNDGRLGETQLLKDSWGSDTHYGSFVPTPPAAPQPDNPLTKSTSYQNNFELPAPAMKIPSRTDDFNKLAPLLSNPFHRSHTMQFPVGGARRGSAEDSQKSPRQRPVSRRASTFGKDPREDPSAETPSRQRLQHTESYPTPRGTLTRKKSTSPNTAVELEAIELENNFFFWLDDQLAKVDTFYREKEAEAEKRLVALREQLHVMRSQRLDEIEQMRQRRRAASEGNGDSTAKKGGKQNKRSNDSSDNSWLNQGWMRQLQPAKAKLLEISHPRPGPNSKALQKMAQTPRMKGLQDPSNRDYTRRPVAEDVPYRTAKHKLKLALQEFYRGLELLKSFALLNRTAFRKLNKKYDKAVNAKPTYRYMHERVNEAYFVKSTLLDTHIAAVEDLYARYFERGNHKIAAGKLRNLNRRPADESASAFRSGLLIGVGLVFAIQGGTYGAELLFVEDDTLRERTSYLMQIYGGYFLMLYLFVLFCLDCRIWTKSKINYQFIFEFDPRTQLDWRQLSQFPAFFLLVFGVFIWANFSRFGDEEMYLYFPSILIGLTFVILFFPAPVFYWRSRRWFLYSHWRLLLAGLYPVEFRDFFLGDIYCSLTYAMCNIELFFCLYHNRWNEPTQCNSSHSRLLGFFSALPPIWRFLQCIRRYYDTRNAFPHLVNCGKYTMSILAAVCLSLYRLENTHTNLALFITFSSINAIYCSFWDIFMDFSLLQPVNNNNFLLRDILGLKKKWPYYTAMVVDPILRFAWIFYAIFTHDTQHNTIVSFLVAFGEVTRRGMWTIFRVENEHCGNVAQYKASRDVPLPYKLEGEESSSGSGADDGLLGEPTTPGKGRSSGVDAERSPAAARLNSLARAGSRVSAAEEGRAGDSIAGDVPGGATLRRRLTRADTIVGALSRHLAEAHKQDFEKRRKPPVSPAEEDDEEEMYQNIQRATVSSDVAVGEEDDTDDMEGGGAFSEDERREEDRDGQSDGEDDEAEHVDTEVVDSGKDAVRRQSKS
ncbi:hypothetical protein MCOR27_005251 [Pyricularia oryzae]|uniref:EXS-domain-containing protein n=1 Tax=Pyricularia grisea TaxID=148305 RepID=A0ABQ8P0N4_PYRGI|nr:hypothetical protein MCOR19_008294 [Pyricularia oryzae]KAI6304842.1 hypothetical protein MCOR33_000353 [Pyricularia grisea]KAI6279245.1 hypothetical protein MCOR27_005251 [Pyricularia oryzae]KAI6287636.1 hypothetical protein MCOR26_000534 [Pyricularia oryzae]KAI6330192.1 hypothetical protein MCOR29_001968 [Pyricularia oryzae]